MGRWVSQPPAPCHATRRDQAQYGPFHVGDLKYAPVRQMPDGQVRALPQILPLVTAASHFQTMMSEPGCPFRLLTKDEDAARNAYIADLEQQVAELELQVQEERTARQAPIDIEALTNNVVVALSDRLPRKPGPKPKTAA